MHVAVQSHCGDRDDELAACDLTFCAACNLDERMATSGVWLMNSTTEPGCGWWTSVSRPRLQLHYIVLLDTRKDNLKFRHKKNYDRIIKLRIDVLCNNGNWNKSALVKSLCMSRIRIWACMRCLRAWSGSNGRAPFRTWDNSEKRLYRATWDDLDLDPNSDDHDEMVSIERKVRWYSFRLVLWKAWDCFLGECTWLDVFGVLKTRLRSSNECA